MLGAANQTLDLVLQGLFVEIKSLNSRGQRRWEKYLSGGCASLEVVSLASNPSECLHLLGQRIAHASFR